jgi:hypothetical protein
MFRSSAYRLRILQLLALTILPALNACGTKAKPPEITVSQIQTYTRPAKPPDCDMPVLYSEPRNKYVKIAVVEGWAQGPEQREELIAGLKRKACATGADALLVVQQTFQSTDSMLASGEMQAGTDEAVTHQGNVADRLQQQEHFVQQGERGYRGYYIDSFATMISDHR